MSSHELRVRVCPLDFGVVIDCHMPGKVARCYGVTEDFIKAAKVEVRKVAEKEANK